MIKNRDWGNKNASAAKSSSNADVSSSFNKIFFYGGINTKNIVDLNKALNDMEAKHIAEASRLEIPPTVAKLHINSGGGSITAGIAGLEHIKLSKIPIYTFVDGFCASAATFLSVLGDERYTTENSFMLIHQLSTQFWGKYSEFEDEKQNLDLMMRTIKNIYKKYTKVPKKELNNILKKDILWDAKTCLKYGLVDEIL